jgi:hypothetical protein
MEAPGFKGLCPESAQVFPAIPSKYKYLKSRSRMFRLELCVLLTTFLEESEITFAKSFILAIWLKSHVAAFATKHFLLLESRLVPMEACLGFPALH